MASEADIQRVQAEMALMCRNRLAVASSIACQMFAEHPHLDAYLRRVGVVGRDLGACHGSLTLADMILRELMLDGRDSAAQCVTGCEVHIARSAALTLTMAFSELAALATTLGVWSTPGGRLAISWELEDDNPKVSRPLQVTWRAIGAGEATLDRMGSLLLTECPRLDLEADVQFEQHAGGFIWTLAAPRSVLDSGHPLRLKTGEI